MRIKPPRLRALPHLLLVLGSMAEAHWDYALLWLRRRGKITLEERADWLHRWCRTGMRRIKVEICSEGPQPQGGLLVANHLSYLDILTLSATMPCLFVAKQEIARWPLFGAFARKSGTIFINRGKKSDVARAGEALEAALKSGLPTVLFAEGTSSDGRAVLPFHSSLFEPAIAAGARITPAHVRYEAEECDVREEICYWGEMTLAPHLVNFAALRGVKAYWRFGKEGKRYSDRKEAAAKVREAVLQLAAGEREANELVGSSSGSRTRC